MKRKLFCSFIMFFLYSCSGSETSLPQGYITNWTTPAPSHTLTPSNSIALNQMWDRRFYVLSSYFKDIQCASSKEQLLLVGSPDPSAVPMIYALSGISGEILWSFKSVGSLAVSEYGLFVGDGTMVYLLELQNGQIIWEKQLWDANNITSVMYNGDLFFVNATGVFTYFVLNKDGLVIEKYSRASDFHSDHKDVLFFPDLPFGFAVGKNIYVEHRGNALYSGYAYDISTREMLWEVERDSISNFLLFNSYVLWISPFDSIKIADQISGELLETITINPSIGYFKHDSHRQNAGYYLCGDNKSGLIYVILGNSHQVFALETKR